MFSGLQNFLRRVDVPLARFAIFLVYFWFGILKVVGTSPANPLVANLLERTMPFVTFEQFIVALGLFEMLIGILFLIPKLELPAAVLIVLHLGMTTMPLLLLPQVAWEGFLTPSLEGQYMLKNILIFSAAVHVLTRKNEASA
jgi:uncharacterized membrane protein YkgB